METTTQRKSRKPFIISILLFALLVTGAVFIPEFRSGIQQAWDVLTSGDQRRIEAWVQDFGWIGPIMIIIVMVLQMFLLIIPSWLLMIATLTAYGPWYGSLIIYIAILAASTVGYAIGKYIGADRISRLTGKKTEAAVSEFLSKYGVWAIIVTRINPFLSNDAISFIAGLLQMRYRTFIMATMIGISPLIVLMIWLGSLTSGLQSTLIWLSVISLVSFLLFLWWDKRRKK